MLLAHCPQHNKPKVAELTGAPYVMQHCAGVNALASWREEAKLFTASKDSTVKRCGTLTLYMYGPLLMNQTWAMHEQVGCF
jgi:hypothetical protein